MKILNYHRVMAECLIFEKISDFSKFKFGVINFDKDIYHKNVGAEYHGNTDKFLYVQSNEYNCPYFMMGILPNKSRELEKLEDDQSKYAVETLIAPTNAKDFFNKQKVVIPTQILVTTADTMNKFEATPSEKISLLNQYRAIIAEYGLTNEIDIYSDYVSRLTEQKMVWVNVC